MKKQKNRKKSSDIFLIVTLLTVLFITAFGFVYFFVINNSASAVEKDVQTEKSQKSETDNFKDYAKYQFKYKYTINVTGKLKHLDFILPVPQKEEGKQYFSKLKFNVQPSELYMEDGTCYAKFSYDDIGEQKIDIVLSGLVYLRTYNINTAEKIKLTNSGQKDLSRYLKSENLIESDDEYITNIADGINGNTRKEILDNMYKYIQKHMKYQIIPQNLGAKKALQTGYGKCSEYAAIMTALCRAKNIPARIASGNYAREENTKHAWVEVYFDDYGWVTYDPTIQATKLITRDTNGNVIKTEEIFETSYNDVEYIKSANNIYSPYFIKLVKPAGSSGKASVREKVVIKKVKNTK